MKKKTWIKGGVLIAAIVGLIAIYFLSPLNEFLTVDKVVEITNDIPESATTALIFLVIFLVGGISLMPIPLICFAVSLVFNWWIALLIVIPGFALASTSGYFLGRWLDTDVFGDWFEEKLNFIKNKLDDKGPWAVLALRVAPTPPFTITSLVSGAIEIKYFPYLLGSVAGIAPLGLSAVFFGKGALDLMKDPSGMSIALIVASIVLFVVYRAIKNKHNESQQTSAS